MSIRKRAVKTSALINRGQSFRGLLSLTLLILLMTTSSRVLHAREDLTIAVAANFKTTLEILVADFRAEHTADVHIVSASTGVLYAQITAGAPFDLFLAADVYHPKTLAEAQLGITETRFTYAIGQLVLWIPGLENVSAADLSRLQGKLSIANPDTAPYGLAARQYLQKTNLWESLQSQLVYGKSITQAFQYVSSGNARAGLVAWSILKEQRHQGGSPTDYWIIPAEDYSPIEQQAIVLANAPSPGLAQEFYQFLRSERAGSIIESSGYTLPVTNGAAL